MFAIFKVRVCNKERESLQAIFAIFKRRVLQVIFALLKGRVCDIEKESLQGVFAILKGRICKVCLYYSKGEFAKYIFYI